MLECQHRECERRILELTIQFLQQFIDHRVVVDGGGDQQAVAARIGNDHGFVALHVRRLRCLVTLAEQIGKGRTHVPRVSIGESHKPDFAAEGCGRLVQFPGERFD